MRFCVSPVIVKMAGKRVAKEFHSPARKRGCIVPFFVLSDFFTLLQITQLLVNKTLPAIFGNAVKIAVKFSDTVKIASKHPDIKRIQKFQKKRGVGILYKIDFVIDF